MWAEGCGAAGTAYAQIPTRPALPPGRRKFSTTKKPAILQLLLGPCSNVVSIRKARGGGGAAGAAAAAALVTGRACQPMPCQPMEEAAVLLVPNLVSCSSACVNGLWHCRTRASS